MQYLPCIFHLNTWDTKLGETIPYWSQYIFAVLLEGRPQTSFYHCPGSLDAYMTELKQESDHIPPCSNFLIPLSHIATVTFHDSFIALLKGHLLIQAYAETPLKISVIPTSHCQSYSLHLFSFSAILIIFKHAI